MAAGVVFMQWDNYAAGPGGPAFFAQEPLTFNSRQERLHRLAPGDRLWLVSRCPDDGQYYFIAALLVAQPMRNPHGSERATLFGEFAIVADRSQSHDLGRGFPAEGLLRAFTFETGRPIQYGASIGQSLQTARLLDPGDERLLDAALDALQKGESPPQATACGLWTKCDGVFADYFLTNWTQRREALAFLLYDPPPSLRAGAPVFIHADKSLRLLARFREGQFLAGHQQTVEAAERVAERERVWRTYRAGTINPPAKEEFDAFWERQNGVRGLFLMDEVAEPTQRVGLRVYGREREEAYSDWLEWVIKQLKSARRVLRIFGIDPPAGFASWEDLDPEIHREFWVPSGHRGQTGRLDLLVRYGDQALLAVEVKKGSAEEADTDKGAGYYQWLCQQPVPHRWGILLAVSAEEASYEDFRFVPWAKVCIELRRMAGDLCEQEHAMVAAIVLAFVAAVEQNLLGFSAALVQWVCEGRAILFNAAVVDYLAKSLNGRARIGSPAHHGACPRGGVTDSQKGRSPRPVTPGLAPGEP